MCVPGCGSCGCSWRRCGCHCSSCYSRITDPVCKAFNIACEIVKSPIKVLLIGAREIVRFVGNSLDIAKEAFRVAERIADAASRGLTQASDSLDDVKDAFRDGIRLIAEIVTYGLRNLLVIEEITFEASLGDTNLGRFEISVTAVVLGSRQTLTLRIDLNNILGTITRPLGDLIGIKIKKLLG